MSRLTARSILIVEILAFAILGPTVGYACQDNAAERTATKLKATSPQAAKNDVAGLSKANAVAAGVEQLLKIQNEDGAWPYEGVYRVNRKIPVGYRIGGTAICCEALLYATAPGQTEATSAIVKGVQLILKELDHPLMVPNQADRYDVRVWGHIYALDLFCRLKNSTRISPELAEQINRSIPKLTKALLHEELETGGWNYANRRGHAGFVTAPAVQALLWAKQSGQEIPESVFKRAAEAMLRSRNPTGAFAYSGNNREGRPAKLPGSIARSANCELTLDLLGLMRQNAIEHAIDSFHKHWDELEKRRKKTGTHKPPYGVAPYYFYYGHRYAALAIQRLPAADRPAAYDKLFKVILKTRDDDGTWNDRVFARSRAYGTAMSVLAILEDKVPIPKSLKSAAIGDRAPKGNREAVVKWNFNVDADSIVEFLDRKLTVEEMAAWIKDCQPDQLPTEIRIKADPDIPASDVTLLIDALQERFVDICLSLTVSDKR